MFRISDAVLDCPLGIPSGFECTAAISLLQCTIASYDVALVKVFVAAKTFERGDIPLSIGELTPACVLRDADFVRV
jgi:hypothetical protein